MRLLFALLFGHFVCDFPLQGDFLARAKNHKNPIPGVPAAHCLFAHAFIQGGAVVLITGSLALGILEAIVHAVVDYQKCEGRLTFGEDQVLHCLSKAVWAIAMIV